MTGLSTPLAALEASATAFWVGASAGFAFLQAPVAFGIVTDLDTFATLTEATLDRIAGASYVAGGIAAAAALTRAALADAGRGNDLARAAAGAAALGCVAYHQAAIVPPMTQARRAMGGFADVPDDDPRRVAYRAMHRRSTRVYGAALLLGFAQIALAALRPASPPPG